MADFDISMKQPESIRGALVSEAKPVVSSWVVFLLICGVTLRHFSDRDFTFVMTAGALLQCLGFWILLKKVHAARSAAGVSSKALEMFFLMLVFRLSSTLVNEGYLPIDRSGDYVYQSADIGSLVLVCRLLWCVNKTYQTTYDKEHDTMEVWKAVPAAIIAGSLVHGNMNQSWFFDSTWTIGMHLDTIAMLPQYWLFVQKGGEVDASVGHFVACIVGSRALSFAFWYFGYRALKPKKRDGGGPNIAGYMVFASHLLQLLLSCDFMFHYLRSSWRKVKLVLPKGGTYDV